MMTFQFAFQNQESNLPNPEQFFLVIFTKIDSSIKRMYNILDLRKVLTD